MKLLTFEMHNEEMLGVSSMDEKNIIPLDSLDVVCSDMNDPIDNISDAERKKIKYDFNHAGTGVDGFGLVENKVADAVIDGATPVLFDGLQGVGVMKIGRAHV